MSVRPSVTFSFHAVTRKRIDAFSRNFAGTVIKLRTQNYICIISILYDNVTALLIHFFKYYQVMETERNIYLVTEFASGGEIFGMYDDQLYFGMYLLRVAYRGELSYRYIDHLSIDISTKTHIC